MHNRLYNHIKNLLLPCLVFSALTGFFSAIIVTAFKILAEWVIHLSASVYDTVRENPEWLPLLILGAATIGLASSILLSIAHNCRGGGIPTSIAAIRGIFSFKWVASIILLPISALLTFMAGLPLGTEGPCVQMGTAVGDGVVKCIGKKKHGGWRRYAMTGGASAGFSIATMSPISAIIFAMEELHKHFAPLILSVAAISVMTAQITVRALASLGIGGTEFFTVPEIPGISPAQFFAPLIVGAAAGIAAILFTRLYHLVRDLMNLILKKLSTKIVFPLLFALIGIVGFFISDALGTGHSLVDNLFSPATLWYVLILVFLVRAVGMTLSNTSGATGGIFLPTLAFGAIIGALCGKVMIRLEWIGAEHYLLMVILGIAAFLGATSRIPLTACVFAIEALGGINNTVSIVIATVVALLIIEASGYEDLTDTIIEARVHKITAGKTAVTVEVPLIVAADSFVVGKELYDVLWPNSCVVISFKRTEHRADKLGISEGDIITVRYITHDPASTIGELSAIVGEQSEKTLMLMDPKST